ncbi:MAG: Lrp/AsnC family transcriptional regulator [Gammaproteobacteria bacterium]|nr:Lrp/AsnC family transcriptional regulator [Gammaproteobacteria bacterium]
MHELNRQIINHYQGGFPIVERPFAEMAKQLNSNENEMIDSIRNMLSDKTLSRFGPLFNAGCLGGGLTLAAMSVAEQDFDRVTDQVNSLAEVAHNYRREHNLNMWFVIATETTDGIGDTISTIQSMTGLKVYNFPKIREFYVGLWLELDDQGKVSTRSFESSRQQVGEIDGLDREIIRSSQAGLALVPTPFTEIAHLLNCDAETVIARFVRMLDSGIIRRVGVVPNHYQLGLRANGMSVWNVNDDQLERLGEKIGQLDFVSHCYQRPRCEPIWSYNLFAMVHGHHHDEVHSKVQQISTMLGKACQQHEVLFSSAILKKSGLRLVA